MSANPVKGEWSFEADGVTYVCRTTCEVFVQLEQRTGKKLLAAVREFLDAEAGPSISEVRFAMWQSLRHHQPKVTEAQAGDLLFEAMNKYTLSEIIQRLILDALPSPRTKESESDPQTPPTGTGTH